jgi:tetratricopeptide (TPR) repeat protein
MDKSSSGDLIYDMSKISLDDLKLAITNNKFGGICFKADKHDKAIDHFNKALQGIGDIVFTNAYQNLGNVYAQKNNIGESIRCYEFVIEWSPHNPKNKEKVTDENIYNQHVNSKEAYIDAYTNLGKRIM